MTRRRRLAAAAAALLALAPVPAAAGDGMFLLCYERLKQMIALIVVQGGHVEEVENDPEARAYRAVIRQPSGDKEVWCSPGGEIMVEAADAPPPAD